MPSLTSLASTNQLKIYCLCVRNLRLVIETYFEYFLLVYAILHTHVACTVMLNEADNLHSCDCTIREYQYYH